MLHPAKCRLYSWSCKLYSCSCFQQILSFPMPTKSQMPHKSVFVDWVTWSSPCTLVCSLKPVCLAAKKGENSLPVSRQHLAHSVMNSDHFYWHTTHACTDLISIMVITCAYPKWWVAGATPKRGDPKSVLGTYSHSRSFPPCLSRWHTWAMALWT